MESPKIGPREVVYKNQHQQIYRVKAEFREFTKEYFVNDYGQRVGLLVIRGDEVLLVRQYRFLVNDMAWEIPGGKIDPGETPEQAAVREGEEETCIRCCNLKPLLYFHPGLDTFDNPTFLFYSTEFEESPPGVSHAHEVSGCRWIRLEYCVQMIFSKVIIDSLSIAALLAYRTLRGHPELAAP